MKHSMGAMETWSGYNKHLELHTAISAPTQINGSPCASQLCAARTMPHMNRIPATKVSIIPYALQTRIGCTSKNHTRAAKIAFWSWIHTKTRRCSKSNKKSVVSDFAYSFITNESTTCGGRGYHDAHGRSSSFPLEGVAIAIPSLCQGRRTV